MKILVGSVSAHAVVVCAALFDDKRIPTIGRMGVDQNGCIQLINGSTIEFATYEGFNVYPSDIPAEKIRKEKNYLKFTNKINYRK